MSGHPTRPRVVRLRQFGQDRLYVLGADGTRIGWLNLTSGVEVIEDEALRSDFERAIASHHDLRERAPATIVPPRELPIARDPPGSRHPASALPLARRLPQATPEPAEPIPSAPSLRPTDDIPARAGASAQAEYEKRSARDRDHRARTRRKRVLALSVSPLLGYLAARLGFIALDVVGAEAMSSVGGGARASEPIVDPAGAHRYALLVAVAITLMVGAQLFARKQTTEAFRIGAEGERMTGEILDRLPTGWHVLRDLPMPGGRGNIDHVVVGPPGVFTIETKNYANGVVIRGGVARSNGRRLDKVVAQADRQVRVVSAVTGATVIPIVVVHGKGVTVEGWFQRPVIDGVRFCSDRRLHRALLAHRRPTLDSDRADRLVRLLRRAAAEHRDPPTRGRRARA